jgi:DNA polymerase I-like protein with 3'-5' exonuclease and polymerase domains
MRYAGVSVDVDKAERLRETLAERQEDHQKKLAKLVGFDANVDSSADLAQAFDYLGLGYNRTLKGNPSFTKDFIGALDHPVGEIIREIKKCRILKNTFVESYILNSHINGKVYGQFHQLRGEGGGTRSGRFSSSTPNLQNIPSRDDELAPLIRGLFIPDEGHVAWRKYDYSQIEYRMLIHFAIGQAGDAIRKYFWDHPDTDYHVYAQEVVQQATGVLIERKPIKNINFGLIYGMGVAKLAHGLKMPKKEAQGLMDAYFQGVPFAKPTMEAAMEEAQKLGIITTILGRKSRFDLWEPAGWGNEGIALPYDKALMKYGGNIQRAYTHKALNRRLQGSAAELMKVAMLKCWEDGIFDYIGVPRLTVHDELDFSDPGGKDDGFREMCHIMETALPQLNVPVKADGEIGPDWGHVKELEE